MICVQGLVHNIFIIRYLFQLKTSILQTSTLVMYRQILLEIKLSQIMKYKTNNKNVLQVFLLI